MIQSANQGGGGAATIHGLSFNHASPENFLAPVMDIGCKFGSNNSSMMCLEALTEVRSLGLVKAAVTAMSKQSSSRSTSTWKGLAG